MHGVIRLSVSEAFGVNARTIRRAINANELAYVVVQGRYKIGFESLVKWSQKKATIKNKTEKYGIGQFVEKWKIKNKHFSPNPNVLSPKTSAMSNDVTN